MELPSVGENCENASSELWYFLKRQRELNMQHKIIHDQIMIQQDLGLPNQNQEFESIILQQREFFSECQVNDQVDEPNQNRSYSNAFEMVDENATLVSEFSRDDLSVHPHSQTYNNVRIRNLESDRESEEERETESDNYEKQYMNDLELTCVQDSSNPSPLQCIPLLNHPNKVLNTSELDTLLTENAITQKNFDSVHIKPCIITSNIVSLTSSPIPHPSPLQSTCLKRRRHVSNTISSMDSNSTEHIPHTLPNVDNDKNTNYILPVFTENVENGGRKRRLERGKCNNWLLRATDGKISALDIVSCVLKIKNKEKARNRLQKYRETDVLLHSLQSYVFLENRGRPSTVISSYDELNMLLKHIRDPGMVAEFLLHYQDVLQSHLGRPIVCQDLQMKLSRWQSPFHLLTHVVSGVSGSGSFIASVSSFSAFLQFKRRLELETATHYVQSNKLMRKSLSWIEYRCHRAFVHKKMDKNKTDLCKLNCSAKLVIRENYSLKSEVNAPDFSDQNTNINTNTNTNINTNVNTNINTNTNEYQSEDRILNKKNITEKQFKEKSNKKQKGKEKKKKNDDQKQENAKRSLKCKALLNSEHENADVDASCHEKPLFFNQGLILEMELCHDGHVIGSGDDLSYLPIDDRILDKIRQLAVSHLPNSEPLSEQLIKNYVEKYACEILKNDDLENISKNDNRFYPNLKSINEEIGIARRMSQIKRINNTLEEIKGFASKCSSQHLPNLLQRLGQVKSSMPTDKPIISQTKPNGLVQPNKFPQPSLTHSLLNSKKTTEKEKEKEAEAEKEKEATFEAKEIPIVVAAGRREGSRGVHGGEGAVVDAGTESSVRVAKAGSGIIDLVAEAAGAEPARVAVENSKIIIGDLVKSEPKSTLKTLARKIRFGHGSTVNDNSLLLHFSKPLSS